MYRLFAINSEILSYDPCIYLHFQKHIIASVSSETKNLLIEYLFLKQSKLSNFSTLWI